MTSAFMEIEEPSVGSENARIAGLESQILNSQEIIVRLNRELDSALLRIATLENVCAEDQNDLHEKRNRINDLISDIDEREDMNERLKQELYEKDEKLKTLDDIIAQLKQHIKKEQKQIHENHSCEKCQWLLNEFGKSSQDSSVNDLHSQIAFDRKLSQLILSDLGNNNNESSNQFPETILSQYQKNMRLKVHHLLEMSLTTDHISDLIDTDDILYDLLTQVNTLLHDSKELKYIRSLLRLTDDNNHDEILQDLIQKRECIEHLRTNLQHDLTDNDTMLNYSKLLNERCSEAIHVGTELNQRIKSHEQTIEQLKTELNESINETIERQKQIDEIVSKFYSESVDQETNTQLNRIQSILQSNSDFRQSLVTETSATSNEEILERIREYKSAYENLIKHDLTQQVHELLEEANQRKNQLIKIASLLKSDIDDEKSILNEVYSCLQSDVNFHTDLSHHLHVKNDKDSILRRLLDYQLIINQLHSCHDNWTNETTDELITKLKTMKNAETDDSINYGEKLKAIIDKFLPITGESEDIESSMTRIHHLLESLTNFRQNLIDITQSETDETILNLFEKYQEDSSRLRQLLDQPISENLHIDAESQTTDTDNSYNQIKELTGADTEEDVISRIKELSQLPSKIVIDELLSNDEKLRNLLNVEDEDLVESVEILHDNFQALKQQHERLIHKDKMINETIERLMDKLGLSSNSSLQNRIDEFCIIFDIFSTQYSQLVSNNTEDMNLIDIFKQIQPILLEYNQLKTLIDPLDFDKSFEKLDYASKLHNYLTKVEKLCELICPDNSNIDLVLVVYQKKVEHDQHIIRKICNFKQQLLRHLSVDDEEDVFTRLAEIKTMNTDLKEKLQIHNETSATIASLHMTVSEQRTKIVEHEETLEKLRTQRERMLSKMKEIKTHNETLIDQLKQANDSLEELQCKEIDYKNQIEEITQQLRSADTKIQVSSDECLTQQELQETMKLEIDSLKNEMTTQRKLYESRCRQIIHEKNQLDKTQKEALEQKHILENENKRFRMILHTIKDALENVDDINSIVDGILKLRQDHLKFTNEINQRNERMHKENEKLISNIQQQQSTITEFMKTKEFLEKRLLDTEQESKTLKQELEEKIKHYELLKDEYQLFKDQHPSKRNSQVAIIDVGHSSASPTHHLPLQQILEPNRWTAIDIADDESLPVPNKHSTSETIIKVLNFLGELKRNTAMPLVYSERQGDLFRASSGTSLAHCVSRDMNMGKGIATLFRDKFGQINELKSQRVSVGGCAYLIADGRYVFYLVTKERYYYKPTMATLEASLRVMRDLCIQNSVRQFAMPRIGCGLDKLDWDQVSKLIQTVFADDDIEITIYMK